MTIMVSVCMITYNHEKYIREAIGGILLQQTNFTVELVIGEDYSTDRTRDICEEYAVKYPTLIRLLPSDKNYGMHANFVRTLNACTGKYIAICEGDDFWTDPLKLQKQVDFLQANPKFTVCFHDVNVLYENVSKKAHLMNQQRERGDVFTFTDIAQRNFEIATCSCLVRCKTEPLPGNILMQDWAFLLYYSADGDIKYIDDVMATYRRNEGGFTNYYSPDKAHYILSVVQKCKDYFSPRNEKDFDRLIGHFSADVCFTYFRSGNFKDFEGYINQSKESLRTLPGRTKAALLIRRVLVKIPFLAGMYVHFSEKKRKTMYRYKKKV